MPTLIGAAVACLGGLSMGSSAWTLKAIRRYRYYHLLLVSTSIGLIGLPWAVTLAAYPPARWLALPWRALALANLFSVGWGVANVLCMVAFVRIGVALTGGILTGLGMALGVIVPMVFRGSGLFSGAPGLGTPAGYLAVAAVGLLLVGVTLATASGLVRERGASRRTGMSGGLLMAAGAGVLSAFPNFAFAYGQGPILHAVGAQSAEPLSSFPAWAFGMLGGALVNLFYAAAMVGRHRQWLAMRSPRDAAISAIGGLQFALAFVLLGQGSLMLGALGASVGWGIYQVAQMLGGQAVGLLSGEWTGAPTSARRIMLAAVGVLAAAAGVLAYANTVQ